MVVVANTCVHVFLVGEMVNMGYFFGEKVKSC